MIFEKVRRRWLPRVFGGAAFLLAACNGPSAATNAAAVAASDARPALWEVTGPGGAKGWIFGTVHALPPEVKWLGPRIRTAVTASDRLVLEIAEDPIKAGAAQQMQVLSHVDGLPPVSQRIDPPYRADLAKMYKAIGVSDANFAQVATWAVALELAGGQAMKDGAKPSAGVESVLRGLAAGKPVDGFETIADQFTAFSTLSAADQVTMLDETVKDAGAKEDPEQDILLLWLKGQPDAIDKVASKGLLSHPGLRRALLTGRTDGWAVKLAEKLRAGQHPFVAVGAAHVSGPDGLPALMAKQGFAVRRLQ